MRLVIESELTVGYPVCGKQNETERSNRARKSRPYTHFLFYLLRCASGLEVMTVVNV